MHIVCVTSYILLNSINYTHFIRFFASSFFYAASRPILICMCICNMYVNTLTNLRIYVSTRAYTFVLIHSWDQSCTMQVLLVIGGRTKLAKTRERYEVHFYDNRIRICVCLRNRIWIGVWQVVLVVLTGHTSSSALKCKYIILSVFPLFLTSWGLASCLSCTCEDERLRCN